MTAHPRLVVAMTGATGALGGVVRDDLLAHGHRVRALVRPRAGRALLRHEGLEWIDGALDDVASLDRLVEGTDAIVHLAYCPFDEAPPAGRSIAEHFVQTNVAGTIRLIERTPATRLSQLLFASSLAVFGDNPHLLLDARRVPLDEDFPVWPREFYGAHKAALEKLVIAAAGDANMNASCWRIGCVIGPYADRARDPLGKLADEIEAYGEIRSQKGSYVIAAADVATILRSALHDGSTRGRVIHVFDRWLDFATLAPLATSLLGRPVHAAAIPAPSPVHPLRRTRLLARFTDFTTDAAIERALARLLTPSPPS